MTDEQGPLGKIALAATSLYVSNLEAAIAWYEEKLALRPAMVGADEHPYAAFSVGGAIVVLEPRVAALEPEPGSGSTTINLVVDLDPAGVREELLRRGVECSEIVESPNYASFLVRDIDGNRFYVSRPASSEARGALDEVTSLVSGAEPPS